MELGALFSLCYGSLWLTITSSLPSSLMKRHQIPFVLHKALMPLFTLNHYLALAHLLKKKKRTQKEKTPKKPLPINFKPPNSTLSCIRIANEAQGS